MKEIKDMTDDELNEAIAEFMGYERKKNLYANESGLLINFDPTHDLNQAFEVLTKWLKLSTVHTAEISCFSDAYYITVDDRIRVLGESRDKNLARTICKAVLMAVRA